MNTIKHPEAFGEALIEWYLKNKRALPFRDLYNPYYTLVSELMLQQTQMDTVIPYFNRFIEHYPTLCALADAPIDDVLKLWEGLGYYRRAHHLHEAAKTVCYTYHGEFPRDLVLIEKLKGVGRYTARAIHSIAFEQPSVAVDGNVLRVMTRVLAFDGDIQKDHTRKAIEQALEPVILHQKPSDFTQAMMELGATVCQKKPKCELCPLNSMCAAYQEGSQERFPVKAAKKTKKNVHVHVFVYESQGTFLLVKRPHNGLLANLYTFWQDETGTYTQALERFQNEFDVTIINSEPIDQFKHVFSHIQWHMKVFRITTNEPIKAPLYDLHDFPYAIAKAHLSIRDKII